MLHLRYTHPVKSFFVEAFIQNEFDDFRALENRQLIGGGVRFPLTSSSFLIPCLWELERCMKKKYII